MNPTDTYSSQEPSTPTDVTARIGRGDNDMPGAAAGTVQKARRAAGKAFDQAKEKVSSVAGERKDAAAAKLGGYTDRLRATAEENEQEDPNIAHFATMAADRMQGVTDYVRNADFSRIRQDAADLAHRHPALFMGGMLIAGLVLGNLAKASVQTLREEGNDFNDGADDHFSEEFGAASSGMGGVSDSFDAEPRNPEPQF